MAGDFQNVPYRDNGTTPNYTTPDWSTVNPESLQPGNIWQQNATVQKTEPTGQETYKSIGQRQGSVDSEEDESGYQNKNPDFYNNQKIINLNSNRYRGLGKRRRLRNDLRDLGQDAVVWNGANMQMASSFSGGQQFNRRNAMDMIRNGRQNADAYSDDNFEAGTVEADANKRVHEYFSEHQNASRANLNHGNWQKPAETPISQNFQNMLQKYQGGYTPGAMTSYAQQLQPTWKQSTANTQPSTNTQQVGNTQTSINTQPTNMQEQQTAANVQQSANVQKQSTVRNNTTQRTQTHQANTNKGTQLYNWRNGDLSNWQNLIGVNNDGKFGEETMRKFNDLFGNGWKQVWTKDGSAIKDADGTYYYNNGRYYDANGDKGSWRKDGTQIQDITPKNFMPNGNIGKGIMQPLINEGNKYRALPSAKWIDVYYSYRKKFTQEYAKKFGADSVNSEEFNKALERNYNNFLNRYGGQKKGRYIYFHKYR